MSKISNDTYRYYLRNIVRKIGLENAPSVFGAEKKCYIFKNFVIFVQSIPNGLQDTEQFENTISTKLLKQQNLQYLSNCGIQVAKILDIQLSEDKVFEIQEKAPGEVLFYTNESNILNLFGDKEMKREHTSFKDMGEPYRVEFCEKLIQRNLDMQKKLKNAPLSQFVKFLADFKALEEYGMDLDLHGENFLYSPKEGFTFIDLPNGQSSEQKRFSKDSILESQLEFEDRKIKSIEKYRDAPHSKILYDACKLFADSLKYAGHVHDLSLIAKIKKNNTTLIEKLFAASKLAGYKITDTEYNKLWQLCSSFCHEVPVGSSQSTEHTIN